MEGRTEQTVDLQFAEEVKLMMYGFGDEPDILPETVAIVESYVIEYVYDLLEKAVRRAERRSSGNRVHLSDILHHLKADPKQYNRVKQLLKYDVEFKKDQRCWSEDGRPNKRRVGFN
jgi:transcription initiation factor TFIID subunit 13